MPPAFGRTPLPGPTTWLVRWARWNRSSVPTVAAAGDHYTTAELLATEEFLDFVNIRPGHDFDAAVIRRAIGQWAT